MNLDLPPGFCYLDYNATVSPRNRFCSCDPWCIVPLNCVTLLPPCITSFFRHQCLRLCANFSSHHFKMDFLGILRRPMRSAR